MISLLATAISLPAMPPQQNWVGYDNLAVYAILKPIGTGRHGDYLTLDEGLKSGLVIVTEKGAPLGAPIIRSRGGRQGANLQIREQTQYQGAQVNTLWLINKSKKNLLLISGEMVVGGQQDRIIGKDTIIPPGGEPVDLGVFCMEQSRWSGQTKFGANQLPMVADPSVRGRAQHEKSQSGVWIEVAKKNAQSGLAAGRSYSQITTTTNKVQSSVESYVKAIMAAFPDERAYGVAVAINGRFVWVDRFESNALFQKYWPKLLRSYALEAASSSGSPQPKRRMATWEEAMRFADARDGKMSYEVQDGVCRLTKIESDSHVIYELEDLTLPKGAMVHASKMVKK